MAALWLISFPGRREVVRDYSACTACLLAALLNIVLSEHSGSCLTLARRLSYSCLRRLFRLLASWRAKKVAGRRSFSMDDILPCCFAWARGWSWRSAGRTPKSCSMVGMQDAWSFTLTHSFGGIEFR